MFHAIYIEKEIKDHPKVISLCHRFPKLPTIICEQFHEVFNRKAQNFRLQKQSPALILAKKHGAMILPTPSSYGIGGKRNYYFSHLLNCPFDCRYCFLQGMYRSANYVLFINFEDFYCAIEEEIQRVPEEQIYLFSGYDCDSLAFDHITQFADFFLPLFQQHSQAFLELRTKSMNIGTLLKREPQKNCIVAYTLSPKEIVQTLEHRTPPLGKRIAALKKLHERGWPIAVRFDPLIYCCDFEAIYRTFFADVFNAISEVHSVSLGLFRLPKKIYKNMRKLYPEEKLFAHSLNTDHDLITYREKIAQQLRLFCQNEILKYVPQEKLFLCEG